MQNESADVELQIFASQGIAEMQKRNISSLVVKAEQKCGSGISDARDKVNMLLQGLWVILDWTLS